MKKQTKKLSGVTKLAFLLCDVLNSKATKFEKEKIILSIKNNLSNSN